MINDNFVMFMSKLRSSCNDGECSDDILEGVDLVISSIDDLSMSVEGSINTFRTKINEGEDLNLVISRLTKLAELQSYGSWSFEDAQRRMTGEEVNIGDLLHDEPKDEPVPIKEVPISPITGGSFEPWKRSFKELVNDGVLFPDETIYFIDGNKRYESILLKDGNVRSSGKAISVGSWVTNYKKVDNTFESVTVNRDSRLIPVDHLRRTSHIGPNAYKLLTVQPNGIIINGVEYTVSTWKDTLYTYIDAAVDINPDNYYDLLKISGRLSGITFKDEVDEVKDYLQGMELTLCNDRDIYISTSKDSTIRLMSIIASRINRDNSLSDKIIAEFVF